MRGAVVWLTGLSGTGKTTVAATLIPMLHAQGSATLWLDSDALRAVWTPSPNYSPEERDWFYGALGHMAVLAAEGGSTAVVSATAPRAAYRDAVRAKVRAFVEVYLHAPMSVLRARDPKGLYRAAAAGTAPRLPGVGAEYEAPRHPEIDADTERARPVDTAARILAALGTVAPARGPGAES